MSENKLFGKTIIWDGDSICAGGPVNGNWATRICDKNAMTFKNYAIGGGTLAEGFPLTQRGSVRHSVSRTLEKMHQEYPDADYVILEGGTNDADLYVRHFDELGERMGSIDPTDFGGNYDKTTFCGALDSIFYRATQYWCGKKIGFIIAHKMGPEPERAENRRRYFDKCAEATKKWGIPTLDLWQGCYLNPFLPWMYDPTLSPEENIERGESFYSDGQHLTAKGYDLTADIVEKWLKSL